MFEILQNIDQHLLLLINSCNCEFFDRFMWMYSGKFVWIPMYAAILWVIVKRFGLKNSMIILLGIGLAVLLSDQVCATFIRTVFQRLRPSNLENPVSAMVHIVNDYRGGTYGFPSCHAANSFALVGFTALLFKQRHYTVTICVWALINVYSRMYLGVHYPGDILVGTIVGLICGSLCYLLSAWTINILIRENNSSPNEKCENIICHMPQIIWVATVLLLAMISLM